VSELLQELGLLLVLMAVAILTYSSLAYFAEREVQVRKTHTSAKLLILLSVASSSSLPSGRLCQKQA
jgi:hypothetical protein